MFYTKKDREEQRKISQNIEIIYNVLEEQNIRLENICQDLMHMQKQFPDQALIENFSRINTMLNEFKGYIAIVRASFKEKKKAGRQLKNPT